MKTIFYSLAVLVSSLFVITNASAQYGAPPPPPDAYHRPYDDRYQDERMQSFYYYPQSNVYYNPVADKYVFQSQNAWIVADRLPHYYRIRREPSVVVYHNGFDVWNDNRMHCARYRDNRRFAPDVTYDRNRDYNNYPDNDYNAPDRRNDWRR